MSLSEIVIKNLPFMFPYDKFVSYENWSKLTTIGVGKGKVITAEPGSEENLSKLLKHCYKHNIPVMPLGAGSNTIGTDIDNHSLIIKLTAENFKQIQVSGNKVECGSGVSLFNLARTCAMHNLEGISQLAGIPGIVGGSLKTNAGRLGVSIFEFIKKIEGYKLDGTFWETEINDLYWRYRDSDLPGDVIVTKAYFEFKTGDKNHILTDIENYISERNKIYPKGRNAGCVFKNPLTGHGAGKLVDMCGCKGEATNSLSVSMEHGNFITNSTLASENDFLQLTKRIRTKVFNQTGIYLAPEVFFANTNSFKELINSPKVIKVLIFKGGNGRERPVSLESAANVARALRTAGYNVTEFDIKEPALPKITKDADVIFPVLHGGFGENGTLQKLMEEKNLCFVGCGSKASRLSIDKVENKKVFRKLNITTIEDAVIDEGANKFPANLKLPVVVKPPQEGSTFGISIVNKMSEWKDALKKASIDPSKKILVEKYIDSIELTAGVFNGKALPLVHIDYPGQTYDYDAKYTHQTGETLYICPPAEDTVSTDIQKGIQKNSERIYKEIGARHLLRIDVLLDKKTKIPYFLEINNMPGFTSSSLFPKAAQANGIPYIQTCATLVKTAFEDSHQHETCSD